MPIRRDPAEYGDDYEINDLEPDYENQLFAVDDTVDSPQLPTFDPGPSQPNPDPQPRQSTPPPPQSSPSTGVSNADIDAAYQQYLGRTPSAGEYGFWLGNTNFRNEIANSPEAKARAGGQAPGTFVDPNTIPEGFDRTKFMNTDWKSDKYRAGRVLGAGGSIEQVLAELGGDWHQVSGDKIQHKDGRIIDIFRDFGGANARQWTDVAPPGTPQATMTGGGGGFGSLGNSYGGGNGPIIPSLDPSYKGNVGQDAFSKLITDELAKLIQSGGATPYGTQLNDTLRRLIEKESTDNKGDYWKRYEGIRELEAKAQRTMTNEARGALASRGLLSEPGRPQGTEINSIQRIQEAIAPDFAREARNAFVESEGQRSGRLSDYLKLASGAASDQAANLLGALGGGTQRQTALANIALGVLDRNIAWNSFLAQYGLDRAKVMHEIQSGNIGNVMQLIDQFMRAVDQSRGGYVRPTDNK